ncbi:putative G-protein coupled receptor 112 [Cricetulus griseus]|uniref:Putative G-protein coupled receptor 112 n=1 Tax=Cricetulus griseus TaxID=10029 RepID=G3H6K7_CRIGR|nr:putative G-protein coupled receptor 112 [Cricetulus griseus]
MTDGSYHWMAFSYITNDTLLGTEDIDLGLAGDHQQLILYNFGKTFSISYYLIPFHWHTICLMWDGVKGRLELFRNKERIIAITDQPHNLPPNGTVVLGHFSRNGKGWIKTVVPHFTGSLYYFQLWDRILENEEFLTCLYGNVVSWEDDVWLTYKISPTVDRRLHCLTVFFLFFLHRLEQKKGQGMATIFHVPYSSISMQTGKCQWEKPRFKECKLLQALPDKIVDLANITISDENADDIAEHILNLVNESPPLDEEETKIIISKVDDISNCDDISTNLTQSILQIISTVMEKQSDSASNLPPVSNKILRIIERAGHKMEFVGTMANLTVARLALAVWWVDHRFQGMAFSISEEVTIPQVSVASCSAIERGVLAPL